ncbi:MAG: SCO family protein [Phycisphaerales bacterium]|nr:SCO family protein [Phycisphaerales bacterium]
MMHARTQSWAFASGAFARLVRVTAVGCTLACGTVRGQSINTLPDAADNVEIENRLGERVPEPLMLRTSEGAVVDLGDYFRDGKPAVLALVYYDCPLVCPLILSRIAQAVNGSGYMPGEDFRLIVVSFDPTNTDDMAARARADAAGWFENKAAKALPGLLYHTAGEGVSRRLADAVGFKFKRLPSGEYAHPAVLIALSPDGVVTRYLNALEEPGALPRQLKLALLEASDGMIADSIGDFFLHRCFVFDASTGKYTLSAMRVMRLGALGTMIVLFGFIGLMFLRERIRRVRRAGRAEAPIMTGSMS